MALPAMIPMAGPVEKGDGVVSLPEDVLKELLNFTISEDLSKEDIDDIAEHILEKSKSGPLTNDVVREIEDACKIRWAEESKSDEDKEEPEDKEDGEYTEDKDKDGE